MRFCSSTNSGPTVTYDASMKIGHIYSASSFTESDVWFFQSPFLSPNPNTKHTNVFLLQYLRQLCSRNWLKNGMDHAQTGNLLENLGQ